MKARYIITPLFGFLLALLFNLLTGCRATAPTGGLAALEATRPAPPEKPDAAPVKKEIQRTTAAVQSARRTTAAHKAQVDTHIKTIAKLRAVLIATALPLQERLAAAEKYAEQLEAEAEILVQTNDALEKDLIIALDAAAATEEARQELEAEIASRSHFIGASEKWKDAATFYAKEEKKSREIFQEKAAKNQSFYDSRWSRWLKYGGILAATVFFLTSAAWIALILYLRTNPTALAARIAGSALSNY